MPVKKKRRRTESETRRIRAMLRAKCRGRMAVVGDTGMFIPHLTNFSVLYYVNITIKPKNSGAPAQCSPLQPI